MKGESVGRSGTVDECCGCNPWGEDLAFAISLGVP